MGSLCIFVVCVSLQSTVVFVMSLCGGLMSLCSYCLRISDDFGTKNALLVPHSYHTHTGVDASMQCL